MKFLVCAGFITCGLLAGCGSTREATPPAPPPVVLDYRVHESDFVPSDHDPLPAASQPAHDTVRTTTRVTRTAGDSTTTISMDLVQGFRVQVFSTLNIDLARAKKEELQLLMPEDWFYLEYDPPAYKIRGGNFTTRFDADRFARLLVEKGFVDSWSVPQRVYKAPPRRVPPPPPAVPPSEQ
jgi:hypothetical protein